MNKGLSSHEAERLLKQYGHNSLDQKKKTTIVGLFIGQLNNFLTILLISAALLSYMIGQTIDGSLILAIVILNALFGLYQEKNAEDAIAALTQMSITKVRVVRDGREKEIDSRELVPGDLIYVEEGSKIAADGMLIEAVHFEVNEASLSGESMPVPKLEKDEVFMGTIVTKGRGYIQILKTGNNTKFGQIAADLAQIQEPKTPLQKKLESISRTIGIIGITASLLVFMLSLYQGSTPFSSFLLAVSLAVAVVPEGLPAVLTLTLSIGVKEMAKHKAIVRKLSAVEAFGSVTVIATDKTGTLTTNKMTVKELYTGQHMYGVSLSEKQTLLLKDQQNSPLYQLLVCGIVCSTASLVPVHERESFDVIGDPTEGAVLMLAQQYGLDIETIRKEWAMIEEFPFDSITKQMSVIVHRIENEKSKIPEEKMISDAIVYSKGAPESILSISDKILYNGKVKKLTDDKKLVIESRMKTWAKKGLRVLAFSYKPIPNRNYEIKEKKEEIQNSIFLGMVAIHDGPRPEAKEAIAKARAAGIHVIMITGDNEITAEVIGSHVGLLQKGDEIITGAQLETFTDEALMEKLKQTKIFARTSPFHKQRIVSLYQKLGHVVAVTGDGVNDSIALKQADVGLAMGLIGTDVARETADIIIADDNFATIVYAIEEGRNIVQHLKNSIIYLLSCNIAEACALIAGLLLQIPHLFYPIQLLYINLVTDGIPALAFAYAPREDRLMKKPPENLTTVLRKKDLLYIVLVGIAGTGVVLLAYGGAETFGRTGVLNLGPTAAFTVLALIQSGIFIDIWLNHKSAMLHLHKLVSLIFYAAFFVPFILQLTIVTVPFLASIFKVYPLTIQEFIIFTTVSLFILVPVSAVNRIVKYR